MTNNGQTEAKNLKDEMSLREIVHSIISWWRYLWSKWIIILLFGLIGGALGFTYAYFSKPIYTATTTFVLEDEKASTGVSSLAGLASMAGVDLGGNGGGIFQGDNILELYKSRTMIEKNLLTKVIYKNKPQLLIDRYIDFNKRRKAWAKKKELKNLTFNLQPGAKFNRLQDSILGVVVDDISKNYLQVSRPNKKLSIIKVEVKAKDEFFAKEFNEEIVKKVNDFYVQTKTKKSLNNVKILQQKTDSVRAVMNGAIYSAVITTDATPNLNPTRQVQRVAPVQKAQFSAETNKAVLTEMVKNLEMTKLSLLKETPLIQVVDEPIYPLKIDKFGKIKGIAFGGILAGFLIVLYLISKKILRQWLRD